MVKENNVLAEVNFTNEIETFNLEEPYIPLILGGSGGKSSDENKICKIQSLSELKRTKRALRDICEQKDNCKSYSPDYKTFIFEEDGEIKLRTMEDFEGIKKFDTKFGTLICDDHGEWGGALFIESEGGKGCIGEGNYIYAFEADDKVYALTSLGHMGLTSCSLHEIRKNNKIIENITIFETENLEFSGYFVEENYLYFYSNSYKSDGLYKFDLNDNELELICADLCKGIHVTSLVKKDNFIYIYGHYNVIKYDLDTSEVETFTNLEYEQINEFWYVEDEKLVDIWDELIEK